MSFAAELLFWLMVGHAVADYPLQGDFLSTAKRRTSGGLTPWLCALSAHSLIHAGAVALVTQSVALGMAELFAHSLIDFAKCEGWLGCGRQAFWLDQTLHIACKLLWIAVLITR